MNEIRQRTEVEGEKSGVSMESSKVDMKNKRSQQLIADQNTIIVNII